MAFESVHALDAESLELFAMKGTRGGPGIPKVGNANGYKVRRVMQITRDLSTVPFAELRILDLACGEGVYAIESALRGAGIVAIDSRTERMNEGARAAERIKLTNIRFEQNDVRTVTARSHGHFDVILFLGIMYHLDAGDAVSTLHNIYEMCRRFVVIDTHVALSKRCQVELSGRTYEGEEVREHSDDDPESVRRSRLLASMDNATSFWFSRESLFRLLHDIGFTSVYECLVPREPFKPENRVTVVAMKGTPVKISSYPWMNDKTETEIEALFDGGGRDLSGHAGTGRRGSARMIKRAVNKTLSIFGFELRRI